MPTPASLSSPLSECLAQSIGHPTLWILFGALLTLLIWLVTTGTRAIVGEYAKRAWFKRHPDEIAKAEKRIKTLQRKVDDDARELVSFRSTVTETIHENHTLKEQLRLLKIEHGKLLEQLPPMSA